MSYGIDIGNSALKVVGLRRALGGWRMTAAVRRRLPAGGTAAVPGVLAEALDGTRASRPAVVGLSGRDLNLQVVHQPAMKAVNYRVMMGYELEQRRGESNDLYLDFCTLREPDAFTPQYLALIGIGKNTYVDERIAAVARASLDVRDAVPNSFALYQAYRNAYEVEGGTVLLLDIGSDNMDMAFVRGGRLIFARNVSSGARIFDQQVAGATGREPGAAEALKIAKANLGPSDAGADEEDDIYGPVRSAAGQLTGFITSSIHHAKVQLNDRELAVDKLYLSGGGARLRGLPEYLAGALKMPVEILDPFRKVDVSALVGLGAEELTTLPTDLAVATGLAQLVNPPADAVASTLSILPTPLKRRKDFFRTRLWLWVAGAAMALSLVVLTVLAVVRSSAESSKLAEFRAKTGELRKRIDEMAATAAEQRDLVARADYLQSYLGSGRAVLDIASKLRKALPPQGISIRGIRMGATSSGRSGGDDERLRAAFVVRRRGPVVGEIETESGRDFKLREFGEPFPAADIEGEVVRWPAGVRSLVVVGEVDENIRGKAGEALLQLRDQLGDASRGMKAAIKSQRASDRAGWRAFEILVTFD